MQAQHCHYELGSKVHVRRLWCSRLRSAVQCDEHTIKEPLPCQMDLVDAAQTNFASAVADDYCCVVVKGASDIHFWPTTYKWQPVPHVGHKQVNPHPSNNSR
jgi:hypothetical protein